MPLDAWKAAHPSNANRLTLVVPNGTWRQTKRVRYRAAPSRKPDCQQGTFNLIGPTWIEFEYRFFHRATFHFTRSVVSFTFRSSKTVICLLSCFSLRLIPSNSVFACCTFK